MKKAKTNRRCAADQPVELVRMDVVPHFIPTSALLRLRAGQWNFVAGAKERRLCAFKARRQYGKTTTLGIIAIHKMLKQPNHTVIFGSAKLSLATEIVRKQGRTVDDFGSRKDIEHEAGVIRNLMQGSAKKVARAGKLLTIADAHNGREPDDLTHDDFADLFEKRRLEFRIYHDSSTYSRTKVIALTPSSVGETGDMLADEIARIKNWPDVWEAIEPIISSDPTYRLLLSTTPAPDDTHLAFEMLHEPPGLILPTRPEGNWFRSEFGIDVLRLTAWDAYADGVMLWDSNTGIPRDRWPEWARELARQATPADTGLGDTVARVIGEFGSAEFRAWYAETFGVFKKQCRCETWLRPWNARYSYAPNPVAPPAAAALPNIAESSAPLPPRPQPLAWSQRPSAPVASPGPRAVAFNGATLWAELHRRPGQAAPPDDLAWLTAFTRRVPCGDCRRHWQEILQRHPPDFSTPENYFAWTVTVHNQVNARLGKAQLTVAEAQKMWLQGAAQKMELN